MSDTPPPPGESPPEPQSPTPPQPHWSADGAWWWTGEKWLSAEEAEKLPTPPPPPATAGPKSHSLRNAAMIVAGLLLVGLVGFFAGRVGEEPVPTGEVSATSGFSTTPPAQASTTPPAPKPSPSKAPSSAPSPSTSSGARVLVNLQGTGDKDSQMFDAPSHWKLTYSFDCSSTGGLGFTINLVQDRTPVKTLVDESGGGGGATIDVDLGGENLQLAIFTACSWRVTGTS